MKYDVNNQNVLRDLGQLQIQLRDYEGYADTRRKIMLAKPNIQANWVTYAVAVYLTKNYKKTLEVLESFERTLKENKDKMSKYGRSELALFEARIYEELGEYQKAIRILQDKNKLIVDRINKYESLARVYQKSADKDKAIDTLE